MPQLRLRKRAPGPADPLAPTVIHTDLDAVSTPTITAAQLYSILPLPKPQSIRVLDLYPGRPADPLRGILRTVDLETSPDFTALSYVWSQESPLTGPSAISANEGCQLEITPNCRDALLALRPAPGKAPLTIWVDAICINQKDEAEKSSQLLLMGTVYTFAETVFVWLGVGSSDVFHVFDWMEKSSRALPAPVGIPWLQGRKCMQGVTVTRLRFLLECYWKIFLWDNESPFQRRVGRIFQVKRGDSVPNSDILARALETSWIERIWTFQEIILASNPVVIYGPKRIRWGALQGALNVLGRDHVVDSENWEMEDDISPSSRQGLPNGPSSGCCCSLATLIGAYLGRLTNYVYLLSAAVNWYLYIRSLHGVAKFVVDLTYDWETLQALPLMTRSLIHMGMSYPIFLPFYTLRFEFLNWFIGGHPAIATASDSFGYLAGIVQALRERRASEPKDRAYALGAVLRNLGINSPPPDYSKPLGQVYHELWLELLAFRPALVLLLVDTGKRLSGAPSWVPDWSTAGQRAWLPSTTYIYDLISASKSTTSTTIRISESKEALTLRGAYMGKLVKTFGRFDRVTADAEDGTNSKLEREAGHSPENSTGELNSKLGHALDKIARWISLARLDAPTSPLYDSIPNAILQILSGGALFTLQGGHVGTGPSDALPGDDVAILDGVAAPMV
ncbi:heterokaryon incompatibility protein-domain-containing protein [Podospora aff. communis PSN243]|uniref:Heterokaryon incompatibility protein-domain-containing protein n=1 Tax=Podospora aff. communis PSN243 TaxID=3040156 RepID=A0AAV9GJY2_9PEZI|nr:heterokaryon incompatibility protein-domain-containing protein [Podospora aff. communis PSN243]